MTEIGDRVRRARTTRGISLETLAERIGIAWQSIQDVESGKTRRTSYLPEIAKELDVPIDWFKAKPGTMPDVPPLRAASQPSFPQTGQTDLPMRMGAICGEDGCFEIESQVEDNVPRPVRLRSVPDAYGLYIRGDSMEPWKEHGEPIFVHPGLPPRLMDYVVVQLKPASPGGNPPSYVKRFIGQSAKEIKLLQYQPRKELVIQRNRILAIHRILTLSELVGA